MRRVLWNWNPDCLEIACQCKWINRWMFRKCPAQSFSFWLRGERNKEPRHFTLCYFKVNCSCKNMIPGQESSLYQQPQNRDPLLSFLKSSVEVNESSTLSINSMSIWQVSLYSPLWPCQTYNSGQPAGVNLASGWLRVCVRCVSVRDIFVDEYFAAAQENQMFVLLRCYHSDLALIKCYTCGSWASRAFVWWYMLNDTWTAVGRKNARSKQLCMFIKTSEDDQRCQLTW